MITLHNESSITSEGHAHVDIPITDSYIKMFTLDKNVFTAFDNISEFIVEDVDEDTVKVTFPLTDIEKELLRIDPIFVNDLMIYFSYVTNDNVTISTIFDDVINKVMIRLMPDKELIIDSGNISIKDANDTLKKRKKDFVRLLIDTPPKSDFTGKDRLPFPVITTSEVIEHKKLDPMQLIQYPHDPVSHDDPRLIDNGPGFDPSSGMSPSEYSNRYKTFPDKLLPSEVRLQKYGLHKLHPSKDDKTLTKKERLALIDSAIDNDIDKLPDLLHPSAIIDVENPVLIEPAPGYKKTSPISNSDKIILKRTKFMSESGYQCFVIVKHTHNSKLYNKHMDKIQLTIEPENNHTGLANEGHCLLVDKFISDFETAIIDEFRSYQIDITSGVL